MAEGLRPHHHQEFEYRTEQYFDKKRSCLVKKIQYMCMICAAFVMKNMTVMYHHQNLKPNH